MKVKFDKQGNRIEEIEEKNKSKLICSECGEEITKYDYKVGDMHSECYTKKLAKRGK